MCLQKEMNNEKENKLRTSKSSKLGIISLKNFFLLGFISLLIISMVTYLLIK